MADRVRVENRVVARALRVLGFVLHVLVGFIYVSSGLIVPGLYLFALWALWGALLALAILKRENALYVFATPFIAAALWLVVVPGLGGLFDWTP
ncbi:MAG: hypothetical protein M3360_06040 [Actinomycetota bacterium]|nr:hypothetical protein [Actinomycetota bacterium]